MQYKPVHAKNPEMEFTVVEVPRDYNWVTDRLHTLKDVHERIRLKAQQPKPITVDID